MINNNSLEDRLNAVKEGKPIPKVQNQEIMAQQQNEKIQNKVISLKNFIITEIYKTLQVFITSTFYGYGVREIFEMDWSVMGTIGVGLIINHAFSYIISGIRKLFNK
ncbi:MAG: hypothetical protein ACOC1K_01005 [Nanoarchaeota archaeon]